MVNLECWVVINDDGEIGHRDEFGVGIINGVDFNQVYIMEDDIYRHIVDYWPEEIPSGAISAVFTVSEFNFEEGQMTFPETGQWDFPPGWGMEVELKGFDVHAGSGTTFMEAIEND